MYKQLLVPVDLAERRFEALQPQPQTMKATSSVFVHRILHTCHDTEACNAEL